MNYNDFDLNLIKVFVVVMETKSMFNASKKLFISQPAVTKSIKKLEEFLGGELFVRTPKGVLPTEEGKRFYESCKKCINVLECGVKDFSAFSKLEMGRLNIGSSSTIIRRLLLPFIKEFSKKYPNIVISITDATSEKLINLTKKAEVDLSILNLPIENSEIFNITKITQTQDGFIASKSFSKEFLTAEELSNYSLILQKRPSNNRDYFESICLKNSLSLNPNYEIGSFGLITDFVEKDMGIAFTVLDFVKNDIDAGRVKVVKTNLQIPPRDVVVITPQSSVNSFASVVFINELKQFFNK